MGVLVTCIIAAMIAVWVWIVWYMRASAREFDRQLDRLIWPPWHDRRRRDDDPLERNR